VGSRARRDSSKRRVHDGACQLAGNNGDRPEGRSPVVKIGS
jgi:hypothetical protein